MKMIPMSIRLSDHVLREVDNNARELDISRTEYIRRAILAMNRKFNEERRRARIIKLSRRVRKESIRANAEFSKVEQDPGD
jgi:metal-responsive CopG/Arc/MetJ family transcriptional regulator